MKGLALALLIASSPLAAQVCPREKPFQTMLGVTTRPALAGAPVTLWAMGYSECPPASGPCPEIDYFIQPCDTVQWTFGDGTSATVTGLETITHTYALTGLYNINVHISNPLGAVDVPASIYIASSPGTMVSLGPPRIIYASELDGSVTTHVTRSGDLSRSNTVNWHLTGDSGVISSATGTFTFAPGESDHPLTFPLTWDHRWASIYVSTLDVTLAPDGAYAHDCCLSLFFDGLRLEPQAIEVSNVDPEPVGRLRDVTVKKGSATAHVPVDLTIPFASCCRASFVWHTIDGNARSGIDYVGTDSTFGMTAFGGQSTFIDVPLVQNAPAGTRTFDVEIKNSSISFTQTRATVTIVDDRGPAVVSDIARTSLPVGAYAKLTLSPETPQTVPFSLTLSSSDPGVVAVPATATILPDRPLTVFIHALAPGRATITISSGGGQSTTVDVQVVQVRRRAA